MDMITGYGNFLYPDRNKSSLLRHKMYLRFNFRSIISPQYFNTRLELPLALHGYALDNGAYIDFKKGKKTFDHDSYISMIIKWGSAADFIVIPDVVQNYNATRELSYKYIPILNSYGYGHKLMFVWQDNMPYEDLHQYICDGIGIFIGGSTEAKLNAIPIISEMCSYWNVPCHVGRVNSIKRIKYCIDHYCTSFDGSGWTKYPYMFAYLNDMLNTYQYNLFHKCPMKKHLVSYDKRLKSFGIDSNIIDQFKRMILSSNTDDVIQIDRLSKEQLKLFI